MEWKPIETAPRQEDLEILLYYRNWLGKEHMVISGHWSGGNPEDDHNATWEHSMGYGDADMWRELPNAPSQP